MHLVSPARDKPSPEEASNDDMLSICIINKGLVSNGCAYVSTRRSVVVFLFSFFLRC